MQSMRRCGLPPFSVSAWIAYMWKRGGCTRAREEDVWVSPVVHAIAPLYCIVRRNVVLRFLAPRRSLPRFFSRPLQTPPSTAPLPFNRYPSLPSPSSPSPSPPPSSGLNCCNLWPMPVDLTVELSHGDLYGLLILQRSSGGWNLAMGFHRFSTTGQLWLYRGGEGGDDDYIQWYTIWYILAGYIYRVMTAAMAKPVNQFSGPARLTGLVSAERFFRSSGGYCWWRTRNIDEVW